MSESDDSGEATARTINLELTVTHALIAVFAVGVVTGGFLMSFVGPTGMIAAPAGTADTGTTGDTGGAADTGTNDGTAGTQQDDSGRVQLSESFIEGEPTLGGSGAQVTIIEISDFGCPWCAEWAGVDAIGSRPIDQENSFDQVRQNYVESGQARFVYKDFPVAQLHPNAEQAHTAANCILEQSEDLYWDFHDELFERRDQWTAGGAGETDSTFTAIANDIGADADAMNSCISSSDGSEIQQDKQEIRSEVGRIGTPTFLIGTFEDGFVEVSGAQPYSSIKPVIDSELG